MTNEEAIKKIKSLCHDCDEFPHCVNTDPDCFKALEMAIKVLSAEPCEDCISRSHFDERVRVAGGMVEYEVSDDFKEGVLTVLEMLKTEPPIQPKAKWIPVTTRPLTDEEKEIYGEWEFMYDCSLPESGQDVLITDCYGNVEVDSFYNDGEYGCYFENNCDDGEVIAWMPLPEAYKGDSE